MSIAETSHFLSRQFQNLIGLWPVYFTLFFVAAADQILLHAFPEVGTSGYTDRIDRLIQSSTPNRPKFVYLGSSRAAVISGEHLETYRPVWGLDGKYDFVDLTINGGTPALMWSAYQKYVQGIGGLPPNSHAVYLFAAFEMNFMRPEYLAWLPEGQRLIRKYDKTRWFITLNDHSMIARYLGRGLAGTYLPQFLNDFQVETIQRKPRIGDPPTICHTVGMFNFKLLDFNMEAFENLADALGPAYTIIRTPVSSVQQKCDNAHGLWQATSPYLAEMQKKYHYRLVDGITSTLFELPDDSFRDGNDESHVTIHEFKVKLIKNILRIIKDDI